MPKQPAKAPKVKETPEQKAEKEANLTKKALMLQMLRSGRGATLQELATATGWKKTNIHGVLGRLRGEGHNIQREKVEAQGRKSNPAIVYSLAK